MPTPDSKESSVKLGTTTLSLAALVAFMIFAGAALAGTAKSTATVAFSAKYAGTAVTSVADNVVDISATGKGTGPQIGAGKIVGKGTGDSSDPQNCIPFFGTGTMTGTARTTVAFKVLNISKGCGDESGQLFSVSGKATVLKATGKLLKAKGTLKFTGTYNRGSGAFSVKFTGTLTK
jgi:hypothetical protein